MSILSVLLIWATLAVILGTVALYSRGDIQKAIDSRRRNKLEYLQANRETEHHELRRLQSQIINNKKLANRVSLAVFELQLYPDILLCGPCSSLTMGKPHSPAECESYVDVPPNNPNWASYDFTPCQCPLCKGSGHDD